MSSDAAELLLLAFGEEGGGPGALVDNLLLEDGSNLLQEDGSSVIELEE